MKLRFFKGGGNLRKSYSQEDFYYDPDRVSRIFPFSQAFDTYHKQKGREQKTTYKRQERYVVRSFSSTVISVYVFDSIDFNNIVFTRNVGTCSSPILCIHSEIHIWTGESPFHKVRKRKESGY